MCEVLKDHTPVNSNNTRPSNHRERRGATPWDAAVPCNRLLVNTGADKCRICSGRVNKTNHVTGSVL